MAPTTRRGPNTPVNNTNPNNMTPESIQAMIDQALLRNSTNGDGSHSSHEDNRRNVQTARPCFYADFMKCQPLNFKGTEGVVGLTRWIEKMESVFNISGCAIENQVKFATCTLLGAALTWWNGQIRTLGPEAYAMTWEVLKKKMTDKYCPQGEIKKLEIELWNLKVKGNDVPAYTERFQELTLICTKFVANETEKVDKYISGLPDNIYGNVKSARPKTLDETIELANDLMDQKLRTYAERQSDNKRKVDDSSRNNHGHQQQPFKRQNVAKVYNMGTGKRKPYGGSLPKCTKCHLHHNGPCTQKCHKCNKVGHFARDCKSTGNTNVANTQKGNGAAPKGNGCFKCGAPGHFKRDCPKLMSMDGGNRNAQGWVYAVGNAKKRGNAVGNPDANVVTGTFLLNNHYASILFDTSADISFISTTFSSLINIAPTLLENYYDVELADGKLVRIDTIIRGCTLNFLDRAAMIRIRDDIPEEDMPPRRRFILAAPHWVLIFWISSPSLDDRTIARAADRVGDVGYVRALQASKHRMMTSIEEVNLRVSYQAQVHRKESEDFYTQLHDARTDHRDIRLEIDVCQRAEDDAVRQMMRTHVLEARAQIDTVEDAGSSCNRQGANDAMTSESIQAMIDRAIQRNSTQDDESQSSGGGIRRPVCCWLVSMARKDGISDSTLAGEYDVAAYTQRFQELALMCTKFLADETVKIDKYIGGLPNNIHGNVMSARPKTLDFAIELANDLMDQKLRTYAER
ncbi:reverse transcriptase domain-containing protein [Tanacetum coccineum]|uniref:Reverse transcriptase domain-containing protein n=2 Tax=Tanacetum coccineum TaxID=301880 RepID=A0ABQ5HUF6_9ASTR